MYDFEIGGLLSTRLMACQKDSTWLHGFEHKKDQEGSAKTPLRKLWNIHSELYDLPQTLVGIRGKVPHRPKLPLQVTWSVRLGELSPPTFESGIVTLRGCSLDSTRQNKAHWCVDFLEDHPPHSYSDVWQTGKQQLSNSNVPGFILSI